MLTVKDIECWTVSGSLQGIEKSETFKSGIDGFDIYIRIKGKKYKLTNTELEQYKVETDK